MPFHEINRHFQHSHVERIQLAHLRQRFLDEISIVLIDKMLSIVHCIVVGALHVQLQHIFEFVNTVTASIITAAIGSIGIIDAEVVVAVSLRFSLEAEDCSDQIEHSLASQLLDMRQAGTIGLGEQEVAHLLESCVLGPECYL